MSRVRHLLFLAALGAGATGCRSVGPSEIALPEKLDTRLQSSARTCVDRLNRDRERAQNALNLSDVLVLLGASAGAAGSIAAAFLNKTSTRRASAVVGAVGALTAGAPKTLDDPAEILTRRARAERHWVVGYKVLTQTTLSSEPPATLARAQKVAALTGEGARAALDASKTQRQKALVYVLDRFIDCAADVPAENFEELPSSGFLAVGEPVAAATPPEGIQGSGPNKGADTGPNLLDPGGSTVLLYMEQPSTASGRTLPETPQPASPPSSESPKP
ncbi:hypothetical protein [Hyalangium gracile]|uniref:hypothetical protein n=1 Tax=Hyalangium gracile TaxID=394092 RepID=UPI001CCDF327|nr:hypothetical protein [Hyalangium gracile]